MIHFDVATIENRKVKIGIDTETNNLYISFNNLMDLFNFSMLDKTCDDVTIALLNTPYREHIYVDETEYFEDTIDYISKQLWVDIECLKFLRDEANVPCMLDAIVEFVTQNEQALKEELYGSLDDGYSAE